MRFLKYKIYHFQQFPSLHLIKVYANVPLYFTAEYSMTYVAIYWSTKVQFSQTYKSSFQKLVLQQKHSLKTSLKSTLNIHQRTSFTLSIKHSSNTIATVLLQHGIYKKSSKNY